MSGVPSATVSDFLSRLQGVRRSGDEWQARCPCRDDDENPSLSIAEGEGGKVIVHCHRGNPCNANQICDALNTTVREALFPKQDKNDWANGDKGKAPQKILTNTYKYHDADGVVVYEKLRYKTSDGKKTFSQRRPDENKAGAWIYSLEGIQRVLYKLPAVLAAVKAKEPVWVVEGEKDADVLIARGITATTGPGGAGRSKWDSQFTAALAGAHVEIIADKDEVGIMFAVGIHEELVEAGCVANIWLAASGKDTYDHFAAGHAVEDFVLYDPAVLALPIEPVEIKEQSSKIETVFLKIEEIFASDKLSDEQKLNRASIAISASVVTKVADTGRLVNWEQFISETDDDNYDWVIPGLLERKERVIVVASEGVGKRAIISSVIPTPSGWTTLGDVRVGDQVIDRFGNPCSVTYISPIENNPDAYRVTFSDGNHVDADAEHQWYTETLDEREKRRLGKVRTTQEIKATLGSGRSNRAVTHAIPTTKPLCLPRAQLSIPPYTLGAWLGDGTTLNGSICSEDNGVLENIRQDGYAVRKRESTTNMYGILGLQVQLRELGCLGHKHIPLVYTRGSYEQRLALVQGLMDTDGYVGKNGTCEFSVNNEVLARGFLDLIQTLGIKVTMRTGLSKLYGRITGTRYRMSFKTDLPVFRLKRKLDRLPTGLPTSRSLYRYIISVEPIPPAPMRCISVDSPDNTYLIGDAYIPTHNTMLARQVAILSAAGINPFTYQAMKPVVTLTIDLENPERIIRRTSRNIMNAAIARTQLLSGKRISAVGAHLLIKPAGIDLIGTADRAHIEQIVDQIRPDILLLGPLYKAFVDSGTRTSEAVAVDVAKYLDYIRDTYNCALWLEHHAPLGNASTRELRPFGSAVWSRWPEFGISLKPDPSALGEYVYDVGHFRGARDERAWPTKMRRGKLFPFEVVEFRKVG